MPDGRPELTRIVAGLRGLYLPDPSSDQMSDYEAYRINAFSDEQVADQVDRRWKNATGQRPRARQPGDQPGLPAAEPRRPDRHHPAGHPDARGHPLPAGRGPQHRDAAGARADHRRPHRGARPQGGDDADAGVHRRSGARRGEAGDRRGAPGQRRGLLRRRARAGREHAATRRRSRPAAASIRATSAPPTPRSRSARKAPPRSRRTPAASRSATRTTSAAACSGSAPSRASTTCSASSRTRTPRPAPSGGST